MQAQMSSLTDKGFRYDAGGRDFGPSIVLRRNDLI